MILSCSLPKPIYIRFIRCSLATQRTFEQSVKVMAGRGNWSSQAEIGGLFSCRWWLWRSFLLCRNRFKDLWSISIGLNIHPLWPKWSGAGCLQRGAGTSSRHDACLVFVVCPKWDFYMFVALGQTRWCESFTISTEKSLYKKASWLPRLQHAVQSLDKKCVATDRMIQLEAPDDSCTASAVSHWQIFRANTVSTGWRAQNLKSESVVWLYKERTPQALDFCNT